MVFEGLLLHSITEPKAGGGICGTGMEVAGPTPGSMGGATRAVPVLSFRLFAGRFGEFGARALILASGARLADIGLCDKISAGIGVNGRAGKAKNCAMAKSPESGGHLAAEGRRIDKYTSRCDSSTFQVVPYA